MRNAGEFARGIFSSRPPIRYNNDPNVYTQGGLYKYSYDPKKKIWTMERGLDGMSGTQYYQGRNPKYLGINVPGAVITPGSSTFNSYNDGTTEYRNDGTVWYNGRKI